MNNEKVVDYFHAMREFDRAQGKKADDFDMPLKSSEENGGVDYLAVSREFEKYLAGNHEVIHVRK